MGEWISVESEMPKPDVMVIVRDASFIKSDKNNNDKNYSPHRELGVRLGYLFKSGNFRAEGVNGNSKITHWMPLPEPPKENT